ncbi:hypothetical protein H0E87_021960, partial [Populus deltoides]
MYRTAPISRLCTATRERLRGNDFCTSSVPPEKKTRGEPHHHLRAGIVSLRQTVEMRECGSGLQLAYITDNFAKNKKEESLLRVFVGERAEAFPPVASRFSAFKRAGSA